MRGLGGNTYIHRKLSVKGGVYTKVGGHWHKLGTEVRPPWQELVKPKGAWHERIKS